MDKRCELIVEEETLFAFDEMKNKIKTFINYIHQKHKVNLLFVTNNMIVSLWTVQISNGDRCIRSRFFFTNIFY